MRQKLEKEYGVDFTSDQRYKKAISYKIRMEDVQLGITKVQLGSTEV